jgi:hypothetical protein
MGQHEDYISGSHKYWIHIFCGLAIGALLGGWFFGGFFESSTLNLLAIAATAFCFSFICGRWGEPAWHRISDWLSWWFGTLR